MLYLLYHMDKEKAMNKNIYFGARIDRELSDAVEDCHRRTKQTKTEILRNALYQYLKVTPKEPFPNAVLETVERLCQRVDDLEKTISKSSKGQ